MSEPIQLKRAQLRRHQQNLYQLMEQAAQFGSLMVPLPLHNQIESERESITRLTYEVREDVRRLSPLPCRRFDRFVGRKDQLNELLRVLRDPDAHWIIAIDGLGGVGKTALAREAVSQLLDSGDFYAAVWTSAQPEEFTGAGTRQQLAPEIDFQTLLGTVGSRLGYYEMSSRPRLEDKLRFLAEKLSLERYLVVVDSLDNIDRYKGLVNDFGSLFTRSKAIVTTRQKVSEFSDVYSISLSGMKLDESIEFLRSTANKRGEAGNVIRMASRADLAIIHKSTGGLPLAMELIVGQATKSSLSTVLRKFQKVNFQAVRQTDSVEDVYSQFFKFIYWDSWKQLSSEAQNVLVSLGAFDQIEGANIEELAIVSEIDQTLLSDVAGELLAFSLVQRDIREGREHLTLHPLTYRFVQIDLVEE